MAQLLRLQLVLSRTGQSRTQHYNAISSGLMTRGVTIGPRAVAWPAHEIDAIVRARIAGKTEDQIRALVSRLMAQRQEDDDEPAAAQDAALPKATKPVDITTIWRVPA